MREAAEVREWLKKAVRFRYPGEEATAEEARLAVKTIKKIAVFMRGLLPNELLPSIET